MRMKGVACAVPLSAQREEASKDSRKDLVTKELFNGPSNR